MVLWQIFQEYEFLQRSEKSASEISVTCSGQVQIDGASGSENTFIVDGQEVTNVLGGALDTSGADAVKMSKKQNAMKADHKGRKRR